MDIMNKLEVIGFDGSTFDWDNPQNGMELNYGMTLLQQCALERRIGRRLSQIQIDSSNRSSYLLNFESYCRSIESCLPNYLNLMVNDGWDTTKGGTLNGGRISDGVSWTFNELEAYLSLEQGDLDFIKNRDFPEKSLLQKSYLSIMYKVLGCFTYRLATNITRPREVIKKNKYFVPFQNTWYQSDRQPGGSVTSKEIVDNRFTGDIQNDFIDEGSASYRSDIDTDYSLSWFYTTENRVYPDNQGVLVNSASRGVAIRYNNLVPVNSAPSGGIGSFRSSSSSLIDTFHFDTSSNGYQFRFYGLEYLSDEYEFKIITAGNTFNPNMNNSLGGVDGFMPSSYFYSGGNFEYLKVKVIDCQVQNGYAISDNLSLASLDQMSTYQELASSTQDELIEYGMSLQSVPCGHINNEYYSDYVTIEPDD